MSVRFSYRLADDVHSSEKSNSLNDTSLFSEIRATFTEILEDLLANPSNYSNIGQKIISDFKARNASGGFLCRYHNCEKSVRGFDKEESRDQHELSHQIKYRCTVLDCPQRDWTFSSKRQLLSHRKQYHELAVPALPHKRTGASLSIPFVRPLDQISDLPYLYHVYGHDWSAISRKIFNPGDPKTPNEVFSRLSMIRVIRIGEADSSSRSRDIITND